LGVSTLKAILVREGIETDITYPNIELAKQAGTEFYRIVSKSGDHFSGQILFTPDYFGIPEDKDLPGTLRTYYRDMLPYVDNGPKGSKGMFKDLEPERAKEEFLNTCVEVCRTTIPQYLENLMSSQDWDAYDIIGFSLLFDQTVPSLCLARRIKQRFPEKAIIFGGPSCLGEMGVEMLRCFGCIDIVVQGEADNTIVPLVVALRTRSPLKSVPGLVYRTPEGVCQTAPARMLTDLDWLPIPCYDEYLEALRSLRLSGFRESTQFESSRGCWWGSLHRCSFCGLNGTATKFRGKSAARVLIEILQQEKRYGVRHFSASDNVLDVRYCDTLMPELGRVNQVRPDDAKLTLFYEIRSSLSREQLARLKLAGVTEVQPGIESLSDHILQLMKKGATAIQQVQCIKWCTDLDMVLMYGIIYGIPGELPDDYDKITELIDYIEHLQPPAYLTPMVLDRFSPYYENASAYGISNIAPLNLLHNVFPDSTIDLTRLAGRFSYTHPDQSLAPLKSAVARCLERVGKWQTSFRRNRLVCWRDNESVVISDFRRNVPVGAILKAPQADIFSYCDRARPFQDICRTHAGIDPMSVRAFLDRLVAQKWAYRDSRDRYLSLPLHRDGNRAFHCMSATGGDDT
jgi:ribosomal peptide maturation radical SAM protein 1